MIQRAGRGRNRRLPLGLAALVTLATVATGCSHPPAAPAAGGGMAVLSCRDAAGRQPADPRGLPVNGVESFAGDTNADDTPPVWKSAAGHHYLLWEACLALAALGPPVRVVTLP